MRAAIHHHDQDDEEGAAAATTALMVDDGQSARARYTAALDEILARAPDGNPGVIANMLRRSPTAELIQRLNAAAKRAMVAIDVPSGLDCDTGAPSNATIRADLTITFVAAKTGLTMEGAAPYVGRVEVADIGVPRELLAEIVSQTA